MIYLVQIVLFAIPPLLNAHYGWTTNGVLVSAWGFCLAWGVTIEVPKWLAALRSRYTRFHGEKRIHNPSNDNIRT